MLVLSRKPNERILIGDNITVSILRIKGNSVRVGIEAPRDVRVVRGELQPFDSADDVAANASKSKSQSQFERETSPATSGQAVRRSEFERGTAASWDADGSSRKRGIEVTRILATIES